MPDVKVGKGVTHPPIELMERESTESATANHVPGPQGELHCFPRESRHAAKLGGRKAMEIGNL